MDRYDNFREKYFKKHPLKEPVFSDQLLNAEYEITKILYKENEHLRGLLKRYLKNMEWEEYKQLILETEQAQGGMI